MSIVGAFNCFSFTSQSVNTAFIILIGCIVPMMLQFYSYLGWLNLNALSCISSTGFSDSYHLFLILRESLSYNVVWDELGFIPFVIVVINQYLEELLFHIYTHFSFRSMMAVYIWAAWLAHLRNIFYMVWWGKCIRFSKAFFAISLPA